MENHQLKRVQFFFGGVRVNLVDDTDDNEFFTPQIDGECGRVCAPHGATGVEPLWQRYAEAAGEDAGERGLQWRGESHYNVTTGFDNNGDGDFNDRPQYALPGTPSCAAEPTARRARMRRRGESAEFGRDGRASAQHGRDAVDGLPGHERGAHCSALTRNAKADIRRR